MKRLITIFIFCFGLSTVFFNSAPAQARVGVSFHFGAPVPYYYGEIVEYRHYPRHHHSHSYTVYEEIDDGYHDDCRHEHREYRPRHRSHSHRHHYRR